MQSIIRDPTASYWPELLPAVTYVVRGTDPESCPVRQCGEGASRTLAAPEQISERDADNTRKSNCHTHLHHQCGILSEQQFHRRGK